MKTPYIGVTGFMSADEAVDALTAIPAGEKRKLMVGVLASSKTLKGIPNKWPNRYPNPKDIAGIFPNHPQTLNLIHFHTVDCGELLEQMLEMSNFGGDNFHGFQLNVRWPDSHILEEYKKRYPGKVLVLQCGAGALEMLGHNPQRLVNAIRDYEGLCEYALIDPSGGQGKSLDAQNGIEYLQALTAEIKGITFGIAGGLGPETLDLVRPVTEVFPNIFIDAEGRLRNSNDNLDMVKTRSYISRAYELFRFNKTQ